MFKITKKLKRLSLILMIIGLVSLIYGFVSDFSHYTENPKHHFATWPALLFNTYFFLGISVFAVFFIALQYITEASWSIVVKRIPEAIISFLPSAGSVMLVIVITAGLHFGGNHVYHWMAHGIMDEFVPEHQAKLDDGTTIVSSSPVLDIYTDVSFMNQDSLIVPLSLGEYKLENGLSFIVDSVGIVSKIIDENSNEFLQKNRLIKSGNDIKNPGYDKIIAGKKAYLNIPFFTLRSFLYILIWIYFGYKLKKLSEEEDKFGGLSYYNKGIRTSAWFIVFFAVTSSTASWDWIMSIDTHWFSTLFGWYVFSEWAVTGFATILLITLYLKRKGYLPHVNSSHIHDLGKYVFAFSLVWTYMWFSQFMLIWYSNIPEEVVYFITRIEDYNFLFFGMVVLNLIFPLIVLMNSDFKKTKFIVILTGIVIIIGHYIDVYNMIMPSAVGNLWSFGPAEIGGFLFFLGIFLYVVFRSISNAPILAKGDPFIEESKSFQYYNLD